MSESKLRTQSMDFAISILNLVKQLKERRESIISNQIGRSGTSIGAYIREAQYAHDVPVYVVKIKDMEYEFAASERSNCVWDFYVYKY